jgi:hypothetical protein
MKTTIVRAAVIGALLAAGAADAQEFTTYRPKQSMYILNYEVSSPVGSFSDHYVKDTSWRGISFEGRSWMNEMFSAGFGFTFNRYSQTFSNQSQPAGNGGTISGPLYRYADQFALKGLVHAYFLRGGVVEPYVGLGLGGVWTYAYSQVADLAVTDNGFHFIASPEVGLTLTAARGASSLGVNFALRYNYTTADFAKVNDMQTFAIILGFFGAY